MLNELYDDTEIEHSITNTNTNKFRKVFNLELSIEDKVPWRTLEYILCTINIYTMSNWNVLFYSLRSKVGPYVILRTKSDLSFNLYKPWTGIDIRIFWKPTCYHFSRRRFPWNSYFQHHNDPKHSVKLVRELLCREKIDITNLPSPVSRYTINPIEQLWKDDSGRSYSLKKITMIPRVNETYEISRFNITYWKCQTVIKSQNLSALY